MKSIVVKDNDSISIFTSGHISQMNEDGQWEDVTQTEDEMEQSCYRSLKEDVKRKEFEKYLISLISNYLTEQQMKDWTNIQIRVDYSTPNKGCKMNIGNDKNIQWIPMDVDFPDDKTINNEKLL
jgi:hypothetical protein